MNRFVPSIYVIHINNGTQHHDFIVHYNEKNAKSQSSGIDQGLCIRGPIRIKHQGYLDAFWTTIGYPPTIYLKISKSYSESGEIVNIEAYNYKLEESYEYIVCGPYIIDENVLPDKNEILPVNSKGYIENPHVNSANSWQPTVYIPKGHVLAQKHSSKN